MSIDTNQQTHHTFWQQHEIIQTELLPLLDDQRILVLRRTCTALKGTFEDPFRELRNRVFTEKRGSLTGSEKTLSFDELMERAKTECRLWEIRQMPPNPWLIFNSEGVPQLVDYKKHYFENIMPGVELLKAKYRFYRCEDLRNRDIQLQRYIETSSSISSELGQAPPSPVHPLQDLRNRCRRLETERTRLQTTFKHPLAESKKSYHEFLKSLSIIEKILFFVVSFFHSFFQKAYYPKSAIPDLPISFEKLMQTQVVLGKTEITFNGESIPLEIRAQLGTEDTLTFSTKAIFPIYRQNTSIKLGSFGIERMWTRENWNDYYSETSPEAPIPPASLKIPKLYIEHLKDSLGQDDQNGDRPITRLMTQIAVEILQREHETLLEIGPNDYFDVYIAGGFSFSKPNFSRTELQNTHRIRGRIESARDEAPRKLFPQTRLTSHAPVYLEKSPVNIRTIWDSFTRFVTNGDHDKEPALVAFVMTERPITWEEQIQKHRLLSIAQGPILPKFFYVNLHRLEAPPISA